MASTIFTRGGGAGIGSFIVVFRNGHMAEDTDLRKLKGAYDAGDQIYVSIIDDETEQALVPASGWMEGEQLHLVARDFDDNKTYSITIEGEETAEAEVKDGIDAGGEPLGGEVKIVGNALVIPDQTRPEPVATIDGVAYYHKQEFDLEEFATRQYRSAYSLLDDSFIGNDGEGTKFSSYIYRDVYHGTIPSVSLRLKQHMWQFDLVVPDYTSRAFTVVDSLDEVTNNTKICLPTCSAYYGFLSEDGKTFISYYNLKSDGVPAYVDSVEQDNAVIPLKDVRLPDATAKDVGKILAVNSNGELVLQDAPAGGMQLYRHVIELATYPTVRLGTLTSEGLTFTDYTPTYATKSLTVVTTFSAQYASLFVLFGDRIYSGSISLDTVSYPFVGNTGNGWAFMSVVPDMAQVKYITLAMNATTIASDTVTVVI